LEEDQRIKNHRLYTEYAWLRMREKKLIREGEALWPECIGNEEATVQYIEAGKRMVHARKTINNIEKKLREDMGIDSRGC
jgi:hypothetical protein